MFEQGGRCIHWMSQLIQTVFQAFLFKDPMHISRSKITFKMVWILVGEPQATCCFTVPTQLLVSQENDDWYYQNESRTYSLSDVARKTQLPRLPMLFVFLSSFLSIMFVAIAKRKLQMQRNKNRRKIWRVSSQMQKFSWAEE